MLGTPLSDKGAPVIEVAPGDTVAVRWWVVQTQATDGRWNTTLRPGDERQLPLASPDGSMPRAVAVTPLSRTGVAGPRVVVQPGDD